MLDERLKTAAHNFESVPAREIATVRPLREFQVIRTLSAEQTTGRKKVFKKPGLRTTPPFTVFPSDKLYIT